MPLPKHLIHQHRRKRATQELQPYPHDDAKMRFLDELVNIIAILFPITMIPQMWGIWVNKQTSGVSAITWVGFFILTIPLLAYAYVHKEKKLFLMYSLFIVAYIFILIGLVMY
ncbi:hypothetical protein GOV04_05360 [Candidatus Woesearchaeota archaeon]|nr:hypothetical protein [Candidatus Woesearchaeota archaeon]